MLQCACEAGKIGEREFRALLLVLLRTSVHPLSFFLTSYLFFFFRSGDYTRRGGSGRRSGRTYGSSEIGGTRTLVGRTPGTNRSGKGVFVRIAGCCYPFIYTSRLRLGSTLVIGNNVNYYTKAIPCFPVSRCWESEKLSGPASENRSVCNKCSLRRSRFNFVKY